MTIALLIYIFIGAPLCLLFFNRSRNVQGRVWRVLFKSIALSIPCGIGLTPIPFAGFIIPVPSIIALGFIFELESEKTINALWEQYVVPLTLTILLFFLVGFAWSWLRNPPEIKVSHSSERKDEFD